MNDDSIIVVERTILCKLLNSPDLIHQIIGRLKPNYFLATQHQILFDKMQELADNGSDLGFLTILSSLDEDGKLEKAGGRSYIEDLYTEEPYQDDLRELSDIVIRSYMLREARIVGYNLMQLSKTDQKNIETILSQVGKQIDELINGSSGSFTEQIGSILRKEWDDIKAKLVNPGISGYSTGFKHLDLALSGYSPTDLIVIAARPSVGKTAFALRTLLNQAKANIPVLLFSYEMSKKQLSQRMVSMESGVDFQRIRTGNVTEDELSQIKEAYLKISTYPIYIDYNMSPSVGYVLSTIRRYAKTEGVKIVYLDYLQLMVQNEENETIELGKITRALKMLAMELDIAIIVLSQLNRGVETRESKKPQLSDLRQSGRIEEDADSVVMLYRPAIYGKVGGDNEYLLELIIRKNRNGPIGSIKLYFDPDTVNITESLVEIINGR